MDKEKITAVQKKVLNLITEEYGCIPLDEGIIILSELIPAIIKASQPQDVIMEPVVDILPEQALDVVQIAKEKPAIDRDEYSLAEKLENEAVTRITKMDAETAKKSYKNKKQKAVAVEEFNDIRRLDDDELF